MKIAALVLALLSVVPACAQKPKVEQEQERRFSWL